MTRQSGRVAALLLLVVLCACARGGERLQAGGHTGLAEASMNFDQAEVGEFLAELAARYPDGFSKADAARITDAIKRLPVDSADEWEFTIAVDRKREPLVIGAFQDDVDTPDLYFFTSPAVAARIQDMLNAFAKAHDQ